MEKKEKMSFAEWLEEYIGVTWEYFDNNYDGPSYDQVMREWYDYLDE